MRKEYALIVVLAIALTIALGYIAYNTWFTAFVNNCKQEGANNALVSLVQIINNTGRPIDIKIGNEELICSTKTLIGK